MSATEVLRAMLDERGVEWDELVGHPVVVGTEWHDRDGCPCAALEHADDVPDGMLSVHANLTPEQAIAATLGPRNDSCNCTNGERTGTWSDFDMQMAYHMGYEDALARRKPDAGKVVTNG